MVAILKAITLRRLLVRQRQQHPSSAVPSLYGCQRVQQQTILTPVSFIQQLCQPQPQQQQHPFRTFRSIHTSQLLKSSNSNVPVSQNESNNLPAAFIDFAVASKIDGDESHVATIVLRPGETLRAESGAMIFMTEGIVSKFSSSFPASHVCVAVVVVCIFYCSRERNNNSLDRFFYTSNSTR
jgi:hypothetical protein